MGNYFNFGMVRTLLCVCVAIMCGGAVFCAEIDRTIDLKRTPCQKIFEYRMEKDILVGIIKIVYPRQQLNRLKVEYNILVPRYKISDYSLTLLKSEEEIMQDIVKDIPVEHKLRFPTSEVQPKIVNIILNDEVICTSRPLNPTDYFPHLVLELENSLDVSCTLKACIPVVIENICGYSSDVTQLIFGGTEFPMGKYPWLSPMYARYRSQWNYQCVGNLISLKHVLTAAHCLEHKDGTKRRVKPDDILFAMGLHDLKEFSTQYGSVNHGVEEYKIHQDYKKTSGDADLAIITLKRAVEITKLTRPVCLWPTQFGITLEGVTNKKGVVAGWGLNEYREISNIPKEVSIPIVSNEECLKENKLRHAVSNRTFCAGEKNNEGPCNGDSGSGFLIVRESRWYIRGVVSLTLRNATTFSCDLYNHVVFTDVAKFLEWITSIVNVRPDYATALDEANRNRVSSNVPQTTSRPTSTPTVTYPSAVRPAAQATTVSSNRPQLSSTLKPVSPIETNYLALNETDSFPKEKYPWLAAVLIKTVQNRWAYQCVGNLISGAHVLTVASCLETIKNGKKQRLNPTEITVALGLQKLSEFMKDKESKNVNVRVIQIHPDYKENYIDGNIAILVFERPVIFSNTIQPVTPWPVEFGSFISAIFHTKGRVVGWDLAVEGHDKISNVPKEAEVSIQETCLSTSDLFLHLNSDRIFCTEGDQETGVACAGDSGSGFILSRSSVWYLRGLIANRISDETGKCRNLFMVDVGKFSRWIFQVVSTT